MATDDAAAHSTHAALLAALSPLPSCRRLSMRHTWMLAALLAGAVASRADAQAPSRPSQDRAARTTTPRAVRGADNAHLARQLICRGAAVPAGWVLVDDVRDASQCGGDNPSALRLYNVWVIERFSDRPVGTLIDVCAATPIPDGWALVDVFRSPELCGHPSEALVVNVKRIRRAR